MSDVTPTIPVDPDSYLRVTKLFSFYNGLEMLEREYFAEFEELIEVIERNRAEEVFVKESSEPSKEHKLLASPGVMNHNILIEGLHDDKGWSVDHSSGRNWRDLEKVGKETRSVNDSECEIDIKPGERWGKRTIDGMKNGLGVEIQFGKYAFMIYDVLAKFGHFQRAQRLRLGIEVLPSNNLVHDMSTGIGYYEQLKAEIEHLPEGYIAEGNRTPAIGLGVGFEEEPIDLENLHDEAEFYQQALVSEY